MRHWFFFFQAEDGIRDLVRSRGLGDVYKRQYLNGVEIARANLGLPGVRPGHNELAILGHEAQMYQGGNPDSFFIDRTIFKNCLLYTSPSPRDRTRSRMPSSA